MINKNWVIGGLIFIIVAMGVGYAALSQELDILGTATVDAEWDVAFTSMSLVDEAAINEIDSSYAGTTAEFAVELYYPGAYAEYEIVVTNNGSISAKVSSISINESDHLADVSYTVSGIAEDDVLGVSGTHVITIRVEWDAEAIEVPEELEPEDPIQETINITVLYVQNTG